MVRLIVGQRGKGKTTSILAHVNEQIKKADGNIVYLDKSSKHMYDLEQMYFDNFLKIARLGEEADDLLTTINELEGISTKFNVDFYISISANKDDLAEELQEKVLIAL